MLNFGLGSGAAVCRIRLTSVLSMFAHQVYFDGAVDVKVLNFGKGVGRLSVASDLNILHINFIFGGVDVKALNFEPGAADGWVSIIFVFHMCVHQVFF